VFGPRPIQQTQVVSVPPVTRQLSESEKMQQKLISAGLEDKVTTIWVGKISPLVEDETIKKLLESCGEVKQWARVEANGQLKSFGFAYFFNAEGALRAMRLLDGIRLGEQKLKLTVDATTTKYIEEYEKKKNEFLTKEKADCDANNRSLPPYPFTLRDEKDSSAKDMIEKLVSGVNQALEDDGEGDGVVSREIRSIREKQAKMERERRDREEEEERKRRAIQDDEERREKRRREQMESDYEKLEREWTDYEREMQREKSKYLSDLVDRQAKRKIIDTIYLLNKPALFI